LYCVRNYFNDGMKTPCVVAFGGGTNSAAMLIEMRKRSVIPDLILFADTGGELPETYDFIDKFSGWLAKNKMPKVEIVKYERETLEENCIRKNMLPSLAYGLKSCSQKYKIQPQDKFCNNWDMAKESWSGGGRVLKLIGYDAGESHRVKFYDDKKYIYEYPLVRWGWNRNKCVQIVRQAGFTPAKSSCFFCPAMKKHEVLRLAQDHPDLAERAIKMENNANLTSVIGLGRNWKWEDLIRSDEKQLKMFEDLPDEIPCGCYDG
jgi:hypothetical protein